MPHDVKETGFFTVRYGLGWDWYWSHFPPSAGDKLHGEIGATYFASLEAGERLIEHSPSCKIIITLRDPVRRMISHHAEMARRGQVSVDLHRACREAPVLEAASHYRDHAERWLRILPPDRMLVVMLDDVAEDPRRELQRIFEFLGVSWQDPGSVVDRRHNPTTVPRVRWLAGFAHRAAHMARRRRWHGVVALGKTLGLRRVALGPEAEIDVSTIDNGASEAERFSDDIDWVEAWTGRRLESWRHSRGA